VLGILLINALVGENGYLATVQVSREADALWGQVARTRLENHELQEQGRRLETDPSAVEEAARRDLGMLRPGETLIVIRDAGSSAPPPAVR
jgi:cell division protein FtsB